MNQNLEKILKGLQNLSTNPNEIVSGTVVPGSIDENMYTMSVRLSHSNSVLEDVLLNTISEEGKGFYIVPKEGSHVVVGSIDGAGEWMLLKASEIKKLMVHTQEVRFEVNENDVELGNNNLQFNMGAASFKIKSGSESLYKLLQDLIKALTLLTVNTPSGVSAVPNNVADFTTLLTRLDNLLSA